MPALAGALVLSGCFGGGEKDINADAYTCGEFRKSLRTKDDNSSGQFIRLLNDRAGSKGDRREKERMMALAIFVACRGQKESFKPASAAIANVKKLQAGKSIVPQAKPKQ
jgi:hypothetical protein